MKKILITGASGLIGSELSRFLTLNNYEVVHLTRKKYSSNYKSYVWDIPNNFIEEGALNKVDSIIHLAGAGIADKRWTESRKKEIINSRAKSAELLFNEIAKLQIKPRSFISASAIGYYGAVTGQYIFTEEDPPGNGFQPEVCKVWESTSKNFNNLGMRTCQLRFGVILSNKAGALKKILFPTNLGLGSVLGSGKQYFSWIHIQDAMNIIEKCITDETMIGAYNVVAPSFNTYKDFTEILAKVINKPFFMPQVPSLALKLVLGEMSQILLEGSRISSKKLIDSGYKFEFPNIEEALLNLLNN